MSTDTTEPGAGTAGEASIPRDPSHYRPSHHFAERFRDRFDEHNRHLDGEIVRRCIEQGEARPQSGGRVCLRETVGGVTYRLVVSPPEELVVTGYPLGINTEAARASGRWSTQQIEDIREFISDGAAR